MTALEFNIFVIISFLLHYAQLRLINFVLRRKNVRTRTKVEIPEVENQEEVVVEEAQQADPSQEFDPLEEAIARVQELEEQLKLK